MESKEFKKKLIVCADDFGYSAGINKGIINAFKFGIVSSAGVMIDSPLRATVLDFHHRNPNYDLGLHLTFDFLKAEEIFSEVLERQVTKFCRLFKKKPSHLSIHCSKRKLYWLKKNAIKIFFYLRLVSEKYGIHIRGKSNVKSIAFIANSSFRQTQESLKNILVHELLSEKINELIVHPGEEDDPKLNSNYPSVSRSIETKVLTSKIICETIKKERIQLCDYKIFQNGGVKRNG